MANKTVTFTGKKIEDDIMLGLRQRIKSAFTSASISTSTPTVGTGITFADLYSTYQAARQAIFALTSSSFGSFTLGSFQNSQLKAAHGIGIVEKTVGELENVCVAFNSANLKPTIQSCSANKSGNRSTYTAVANGSNFSAHGTNSTHRSGYAAEANAANFGTVNNGNRSGYTAEKNATNFSNYFSSHRTSFTGPQNKSNFSGYNSGNRTTFTAAVNGSNFSKHNSNNRSSGQPFAYMVFHAAQGGVYSTVHNGVKRTNFSGFGSKSSNRSTFTASVNKSNFTVFGSKSSNRSSFAKAVNSNNFSNYGSNTTNRSTYTATGNGTNFSANGTNTTNRSSYTPLTNSTNFATVNNTFRSSFIAEAFAANFSDNHASNFTSFQPAFFASVQQTCIAVHSSFKVEGVDAL
jgi:hypothetical protein